MQIGTFTSLHTGYGYSACGVWYDILHFVFGCILPRSAFFLNTGFKCNAGKNLFDPVFLVMDRQGAVHQISKYCFLLSCCAHYISDFPLHLSQKYTCTLVLWERTITLF